MNNSSYLVAAILGVLAFILTVNVGFAQVSFRTDLVGEAEVPPIFSESTGSALIAGNDSSLKYPNKCYISRQSYRCIPVQRR